MQRPDEKKANKDWNWSSYFAAKKQKLEEQYIQDKNELDVCEETKNLFNNIGIIVNGYTNPTAIELKDLMIKHGGYYYEYMNDKVNFIVASNLAHSKAVALKNKTVIRPDWILDCIKEKKLLSIDNYLLETSVQDKAQNKLTDYIGNKEKVNERLAKKRKNVQYKQKHTYIDITKSPTKPDNSKNRLSNSNQSKYLKDYQLFKEKLKKFETNKNLAYYQKEEIELESLKGLLNDWITWTSNKNKNQLAYSYSNRKNQQEINTDDVEIFKNYLLHLTAYEKDFNKLQLILKIFKRLVLKNGSYEWIEIYKDLTSSIQTEFFEKYDSTLYLD